MFFVVNLIYLIVLPWTRPFFKPWMWNVKWILKFSLLNPYMVILLLIHLLILLPLHPHPHPTMHPGVPFTKPTRMHLWTSKNLKAYALTSIYLQRLLNPIPLTMLKSSLLKILLKMTPLWSWWWLMNLTPLMSPCLHKIVRLSINWLL